MTGKCKLCNAVLTTPADDKFDAGRDDRERQAFIVLIARHVDMRNDDCTADPALRVTRWNVMQNNNGVFQRWRLFQAIASEDPAVLEKSEIWRGQIERLVRAPIPGEEEPPPPAKAGSIQ